MTTRRLLIFLTVVVALCGCKRSRSGQLVIDVPTVVAAVVFGGGNVLLDPLATASILVGLVTVRNETAVGTANGDIEYRVDCPPGCEASPSTMVLAPGEEAVLQIFTTLVLAAVLTVSVVARYTAGTLERAFPVAWTNLAFGSAAFTMLSLISLPVFAVLWFSSAILTPVGILTRQSNPLVPQRIPALAQDVRLFGAIIGLLTLIELSALFSGLDEPGAAVFPNGQGANGFTIAASPSSALQAGEYVTFWMSVSDDIPLQSTTEFFQYAFVCDSDADVANNFVPATSFPDDFFGGTDRWYELNYTPSAGWSLRCRVVGAGNVVTTVASGARAIIQGDTILMVVPRSEFVVPNPPFRVSTFAHLGDFGQNAPFVWSGDPTPTVAEGLHSWQ